MEILHYYTRSSIITAGGDKNSKDQARNSKTEIPESSIAFIIKTLRVESNLTQENLAIACGVSLSFIRNLEQGKLNLKLNKVIQVAEFLGADIIAQKRKP